jgi:hypothetical protein
MMKERALELAKKLEWYSNYPEFVEAGEMIRRLVEELDKQKPLDKPEECKNGCPEFQICDYCQQTKPLNDEEIKNLHEQTSWWGISDPVKFARAIEERHGIK